MIPRESFARHLGIDLASKKEAEVFKWFLACLLFGKPIQTEIAEQAYRELAAAGLTSPDAILRAGWDKLVLLLDRAHYVRYDFSTATKLLEVSQQLKRRYGTLRNLLAQASQAVFGSQPGKTRELTKWLYKKTLGHPYFLAFISTGRGRYKPYHPLFNLFLRGLKP